MGGCSKDLQREPGNSRHLSSGVQTTHLRFLLLERAKPRTCSQSNVSRARGCACCYILAEGKEPRAFPLPFPQSRCGRGRAFASWRCFQVHPPVIVLTILWRRPPCGKSSLPSAPSTVQGKFTAFLHKLSQQVCQRSPSPAHGLVKVPTMALLPWLLFLLLTDLVTVWLEVRYGLLSWSFHLFQAQNLSTMVLLLCRTQIYLA